MVVSLRGVNGGGLLAASVGLAFDDELVGGGDQPVDGRLREEWVGHHRQPLIRGAVGGHHGGGALVAFHAQLVEVGGGGGVQPLEREVVQDQQLDAGEL